ncbi:ferritin light chain-like [Sorex araneus]|uniref:ferritin light chain-like n=1 Tax=Sorex araneus TaxID=42254 RepID=UPI002433FCAC|nr:ferritin light chain-like [Sorex araneus]
MNSWVRQNYSTHAEDDAVNHLINKYLRASYTYLSMSYYFTPEKGALEPVGRYFRQLSKEKYEGAWKLMSMQTDRGHHLVFHKIQKPSQDLWGTVLEGMEAALTLEKKLNQALLELHALGRATKTPHLCSFLRPLLNEEVKLMQEIGDWLTILRRLGGLLGGVSQVFP